MFENKTETLQVRVTPTQAEEFRRRAAEDGRRISEWLREIARREVERTRAGMAGRQA